MRITVLPRVVVTDKTMLITTRDISSFLLPPLENFGKQDSSSNVVYPSPLCEDECLNCVMISTDIHMRASGFKTRVRYDDYCQF